MLRKIILCCFIWSIVCTAEAKVLELTPGIVTSKLKEIMKLHATHKELNTAVMKRTLKNYIENIDSNKVYFIKSDINHWYDPSEATLDKVLREFRAQNFSTFYKINQSMLGAIKRRHLLEKELKKEMQAGKIAKVNKVDPKKFKKEEWAQDEKGLLERLVKYHVLEKDAYEALEDDLKEKSFQRMKKYQTSYEENYLNGDSHKKHQFILVNVLKAAASALDSQTAYFTPDEASQFMINVQQRLFGIGAQLRDDINGFSVVKIVEGGPAAREGKLKVKDKIIAVNNEPVVGKDIYEVVGLIRGKEDTPVVLTVLRPKEDEEDDDDDDDDDKNKPLVKLDISVSRGEVVLKESRYKVSQEPYADGVILYMRLFSFYEDGETSSTMDLLRELEKVKKEDTIKGIVLDLRFNSGGLLSQAVGVTGLFISKGIVVGIKDNREKVQYLRDINGKAAWDGPLLVLVNKASASASEIVAQTLQDYGRALVVGDDTTFGKGSFQTFTLSGKANAEVNPQGEYKVTRGRYYTVSGKSPQLVGVKSDLVIPGVLSKSDVGEKFSKYPLENDSISANFEDDLSDIPFMQREKIEKVYRFNLQPKLTKYRNCLTHLTRNSENRLNTNKKYQEFLKEIDDQDYVYDEKEEGSKKDLQLVETFNVMKDFVYFLDQKKYQDELTSQR